MTRRNLKNLDDNRYTRLIVNNAKRREVVSDRIATKMSSTIDKIREELGKNNK